MLLQCISSLALCRYLWRKWLWLRYLRQIYTQSAENKRAACSSFSCWKKNDRIKYCTIKKIDYVFKPAIVTRNRCLISFFLVHLPCSETLCSCDICSFKKLKEVESTLPPGSSMPYISSWSSSQFSRTSLPASAPLAPRTGYEPPYWHRPCYFGWRYVTRGEGQVLLVMTLFKKNGCLDPPS